jgi:hypothetical protein
VAEIQAPIVPRRLYRYRSLTRSAEALAEEISSITNRYLYCADFNLMNDPMEGLFFSSASLRAAPDYRDTVRRIRDSKSGVGIACFTETFDNMLMWAHYAGNFEGVCFGYSSYNLIKGLPEDTGLVRVAYLDKPPRVSSRHAGNIDVAARNILSQKQYSWSYEREWRVLGTVGRVSYGRHEAIREIYFGSRISEAQRDLLLKSIVGMDIKVRAMELKGYKPSWREIKVPTQLPVTPPTKKLLGESVRR